MNKAEREKLRKYCEHRDERERQDLARAEYFHKHPGKEAMQYRQMLVKELQRKADQLRMNFVGCLNFNWDREMLIDAIQLERLEQLAGRSGMQPWDLLVQRVNRGGGQINYPTAFIGRLDTFVRKIEDGSAGDLYGRRAPRAETVPIFEAARKISQSYLILTGIVIEDNPFAPSSN